MSGARQDVAKDYPDIALLLRNNGLNMPKTVHEETKRAMEEIRELRITNRSLVDQLAIHQRQEDYAEDRRGDYEAALRRLRFEHKEHMATANEQIEFWKKKAEGS